MLLSGGGLAGIEAMSSEEHTSELQSQSNLVCRLLLEKKNGLRQTQQGRASLLVRQVTVDRHLPHLPHRAVLAREDQRVAADRVTPVHVRLGLHAPPPG